MKSYEELEKENQLFKIVIQNFPEYTPYKEYGDLVERCPYCGEYSFNNHRENCIRNLILSQYNYKDKGIEEILKSKLPNLDLLK